jgi:hypothetical protein
MRFAADPCALPTSWPDRHGLTPLQVGFRLQELGLGRALRQVEVTPGAGHPVRALLTKAVGAVAVPEVEVLPGCAAGCRALFNRLTIDEHRNRPP